MFERRLTMRNKPSEEFLQDVITTALEGGIGYWAVAKIGKRGPDLEYIWTAIMEEECSSDKDNLGWQCLDADMILRGIDVVLAGKAEVNKNYLRTLEKAVVNSDACDVDAELADIVVQAGFFGRVIYG
jgi:hypothetical protein